MLPIGSRSSPRLAGGCPLDLGGQERYFFLETRCEAEQFSFEVLSEPSSRVLGAGGALIPPATGGASVRHRRRDGGALTPPDLRPG